MRLFRCRLSFKRLSGCTRARGRGTNARAFDSHQLASLRRSKLSLFPPSPKCNPKPCPSSTKNRTTLNATLSTGAARALGVAGAGGAAAVGGAPVDVVVEGTGIDVAGDATGAGASSVVGNPSTATGAAGWQDARATRPTSRAKESPRARLRGFIASLSKKRRESSFVERASERECLCV